MEMGEALSRNRRRLIGAGIALTVIVFSIWQWNRSARSASPTVISKAFYTTDDGRTLFVDDLNKLPPFDHNGQPAMRAYVFTCDDGQHQWVQYLEKYADDAKAQMAAPRSDAEPPGPSSAGLLVKKPDKEKWVRATSPAARDICNPTCPKGSGTGKPQAVMP